ncbi:type I-E CRISPR-associated protein Cse2/CasB [Thetidibacter halocola]|uniref:Type I-E CRISPR-associated protein Cse2/CasB n=1 Tax=Thetidibacter halocola TaxID=2827239 RepID=A0A8J8B9I7_9RHOB|nr:type I-E CRISPR-associated protein Cse2/CasB [Thetidibacter halocola]MBS0126542.1 type I-E CRISPR-associated protein Cse2/CasB [Thetidibacter halocola]
MIEDPKGLGAVALGWWRRNIEPRDNPAARALSARLRRGAPMAVLCEPRVQDLAHELSLGPSRAAELVRLAALLAELRENDPAPLPRRVGGEDPVLSQLRFQRLLRAEGEELTAQLRRAIVMADRSCNVAALASDLLRWDAARPRWCFHYFGADAPAKDIQEKTA